MIDCLRHKFFIFFSAAFCSAILASIVPAQQPETSSVIHQVDAAVKARVEHVAGYTATEHYEVFRNKDESHPVAEMTVKATYKQNEGKTYTIISQTGSEIIRSMVLDTLLDNEKRINLPGVREGAWITSANYEMKLKPGGTQWVNGRECLVLALTPRRKAPHLIDGSLWIDAKDYSIVQIQGTASKSPSFLTGPTQMLRQYANVSGYSQATHVRAVSNSPFFGQTIVTIDYKDYQIQLRPAS